MPAEASAAGSLQLVRYLGVLRRRKWTVVVVTILAFATALGFSKSETPTYDASSEVLLQNSSSPLTELLGTGSPFQPNITDEIQRLQSPSRDGAPSLRQLDRRLGHHGDQRVVDLRE